MTTVPLPAFELGHLFEGIFRRLSRSLGLRLAPTRQL